MHQAATGASVAAPPRARLPRWSGGIDPSKIAVFHAKVLSKLIPRSWLTARIEVAAEPDAGLSQGQVNDVRQGLADLGLEQPDVADAAPST